MKKIFSILVMLFISMICFGIVSVQAAIASGTISGLKTIGPSGDFTTLQSAFNTINTEGLSGATVLELQSDYNPGLETYPINTGILTGSSAVNTVTLRPAAGAAGIIFSSVTAQTFNIAGTKFFIIDGRPGGTGTGQEITISNSNAVLGNAVRFSDDATDNILKYCKFNGVNSPDGVILIGTSAGTTGNDNITIDNCEVRDGAAVPVYLINTSGSSLIKNDNIIITNCRLFNFSNTAIVSTFSDGTGSNYIISNNHIYQSSTPPAGVTTSTTLRGIRLIDGSNHLISNNYIGGQDVNCGGNPYLNSANVTFTGIDLGGDTSNSVIQNNTIQNINLISTGFVSFTGILNECQEISNSIIRGNTIGHNSTPNSISSAGSSTMIGISSQFDNGIVSIENNLVANLNATGTGTGVAVRGIIRSTQTATSINIINNVVHDLTTNSTNTSSGVSTNGASVYGIGTSSSSLNNRVEGNIVYALRNLTTETANTHVVGIGGNSSTPGIYSRNRIYDLTNTSTGSGPSIVGLISPRNATIANNQISITNASNTNAVTISGISHAINFAMYTINYYYNSVYIGGTAASGSLNSNAFIKTGSATTNLRNNIFYNERTGGTGNHYAEAFSTNNGTLNLTTDYNLLIGNASTIGLWNATAHSFESFKSTSAKDVFSLSNQPVNIPANNLFVDKSVGNMNILSANNEAFYSDGKGIPILGQSDDYSSTNVRDTLITQGTTDIGSDEFDYTGTVPNLTESAPPALSTTTTYSFGGRQLASITWGNTGTVPSSIAVTYNSGVNPPGTLTGQYSNGYWEITPAGGIGYTYDITLNYSPAILFNIANVLNLKLAKRDGSIWDYLSTSSVDTTAKTVTATGLNSFSQFALTSSDAPLPVELASFTSMTIRNEVILDWSTISEINNASFEIERSQVAASESYVKVGSIQGSGTTNEVKKYKFNDRNIQTGMYKYRLKQIDFNGNFQYFDLSNEVNVGVPDKYDLSQNYPNPFNPVTKINYDLPKDGKVNLRIYDITGREVAALINNEVQPAGYYTLTFNAGNLSSGVYFYRLVAGDFVSTKKLVLLK